MLRVAFSPTLLDSKKWADMPTLHATWALGFRPFYLLASGFAALSIPLWALQVAGVLPFGYLTIAAWHGHEMLAGFALAVVAGFLFTAVPNWTGKPTPKGRALAAIALLWLAARLLMLGPWPVAAAVANVLFPVAVAVGIGIPLAQSRNRRNYFFVVMLLLLAIAILAVHLALRGVIDWPARASLQVGLDIVLFIIAVVGGRVIPMFTNNGVPGAQATRTPWVERLSLGGVLALLAADVVAIQGTALAVLAVAVGIAHAARLALWHPARALRAPLVWVLHAAYAWIPIHLALRAAAALGWVSDTAAIHALTVGVIGAMTLGMMTRTARGHSGLPLQAGKAEVAAYALVLVAAVVRVFGPMLPDTYAASIALSSVCWSAAFATYFVRYWPMLTRPRLDGRPG